MRSLLFGGLLTALVGCAAPDSAERTMAPTYDKAVTTDITENDVGWGLDRVDQSAKHLNGKFTYPVSAGAGVHLYFIDSGIRSSHADFTGRIGAGADFVGDGLGTDDCIGHGTMVAGIAAGTVYGVAKRATLHPLRVIDCARTTNSTRVRAAIDWVRTNGQYPGVVVIGVEGPTDPEDVTAIESLVSAGFVVVGVAGNDVGDACDFVPGSAPNALTVAASTSGNGKTGTTNTGPCVDFFAPGDAICSDWNVSDTALHCDTGTSFAAPFVAGAVALYLAPHPFASPADVRAALVATATNGLLTGLPANTVNRIIQTPHGIF